MPIPLYSRKIYAGIDKGRYVMTFAPYTIQNEANYTVFYKKLLDFIR
jgi:hypothetical protein